MAEDKDRIERDRAERLAAALRDNLRKRKVQAREVDSQAAALSEPRRTPD